MMKIYLIGKPLGHSWSPVIHSYLADYSYELKELEADALGDFILHGDYDGLNVTIPYKRDVMKYLDEISPEAERIGAVNTVVRRGGKLCGYNTDYCGFSALLDSIGLDVRHKKVLILGTGGSFHTVRTVLTDRGSREIIPISRSGDDNYENISRHADADVIVNTTPVGMYPKTGVSPVDLSVFPRLSGVVDIVYNPEKTELILSAEERGIPSASGLTMLVAQAKAAAEYFVGGTLGDCVPSVAEIVGKINAEKRNTVLVGMPGCGKSSVGHELAKLTGKRFYDTDEVIAEKYGRTPAEIIKEDGEAAFRKIESEVLASLTRESSLIIATGGGAVIKAENRRRMRENGTVVFIERPLYELSSDGRPLSQQKSAEELWAERKEFYLAAADITVKSCRTPLKTAEEIIKETKK